MHVSEKQRKEKEGTKPQRYVKASFPIILSYLYQETSTPSAAKKKEEAITPLPFTNNYSTTGVESHSSFKKNGAKVTAHLKNNGTDAN